jgi:serine/threonine protein phosphatase 1
MRTLAIGDIHGCSAALETVLDTADVTPDDLLIFLGDYIDRGPDSKAAVSHVIDLGRRQSTIALRGNHEVMILSAREDPIQATLWASYGGNEALHSYGAGFHDNWARSVPIEHWKFFELTRPWFETRTHIFVHAAVLSHLPMIEQPDYILFWERYYHDLRHDSGKMIICGHTPQPEGRPSVGTRAVCIDTGIGTGNWLTCLDVQTGEFWQANQERRVRAGKLHLPD